MTLPSSGPLTLAQIAGEWGGSAPYTLSNYYAGGAFVPSGTTSPVSGPIPSSGAISFDNFYGTTKFTPVVHTYSNTSGTETIPNGATTLTLEVWGSGAGGGRDNSGALNPGGGSSGSYCKSVFSVGSNNGQTINFFAAAGAAAILHPNTAPGNNGAASTATGNTFSMTAMNAPGGLGGPTNGTSGAPANATGGNTQNLPGISGGQPNGAASPTSGGPNVGGDGFSGVGSDAGGGGTGRVRFSYT